MDTGLDTEKSGTGKDEICTDCLEFVGVMLCKAGVLPVIKVGKDYISSPTLVEKWMIEHEGKEINA